MLTSSRAVCLFVLVVATAEGRAGWLSESREAVMEQHRNDSQQIGLATLRNVRQLSQDHVNRVYGPGFLSDRPAFALRVEFAEILRGKPSDRPLEVPFAFISGSEAPHLWSTKTNEQREAQLEGHKAVVIVHPGRSPEQPVVINVWLVASFEEDDTARFWRKTTRLWNTADPKQRQDALRAGCRDALPEFQDYCCRRLANWSGGKPDPNAAEQFELLLALPVIWNVFQEPDTSMGVLATCDEILGRMSPGWRTHATRYDVLAAGLRRHSQSAAFPDDSQTDFDILLQKLAAVSHFPGKERKAYQLFDEIIRSSPQRYGPIALSHLSHLYRPHSQDADQQRLNQEIWDRLVAASNKPDTAVSAAAAMYDIARDYAYVGPLPAQVSEALAAPRNELPPSLAFSITSRFEHLQEELRDISLAAPIVERLRKENHENLSLPTRSQVGKKVVFVTMPDLSLQEDKVFGSAAWSSWCNWHGEPIWIEKPAAWPKGGTGLMVVTGTLAERHDVLTFRLPTDTNAPFQPGLPVPDGYDVHEIRRRYVLVDVTWQLVAEQSTRHQATCCSPTRPASAN